MDSVLRFLLRLIIVPFGYLAAAIAGALVILFASIPYGEGLSQDDVQKLFFFGFGFIVAAPVILAMIIGTMWLPGAVGILISEAFAIRSWIFHAFNGAVSAWIGWQMLPVPENPSIPWNDMKFVVAAGLAGGFAYWAVAGWSAGFWKPVFERPAPPASSGNPFNPPAQTKV